jgi:hypothetical protein
MSLYCKAFDWSKALVRLAVATAVGALLGAGYGLMVSGVHLVTSGRWDSGWAFTFWAACTGAGLGLGVGIGLALSRRSGPAREAGGPLSSSLAATLLRSPASDGAFCTGNPGWRS